MVGFVGWFYRLPFYVLLRTAPATPHTPDHAAHAVWRDGKHWVPLYRYLQPTSSTRLRFLYVTLRFCCRFRFVVTAHTSYSSGLPPHTHLGSACPIFCYRTVFTSPHFPFTRILRFVPAAHHLPHLLPAHYYSYPYYYRSTVDYRFLRSCARTTAHLRFCAGGIYVPVICHATAARTVQFVEPPAVLCARYYTVPTVYRFLHVLPVRLCVRFVTTSPAVLAIHHLLVLPVLRVLPARCRRGCAFYPAPLPSPRTP